MMLEGGRISGRQAAFLIVNTILATSLIFLPTSMFRISQQDAWISVILVTIFGTFAGLVIYFLGIRYPGKTIIQYSGEIVGKIPGKIIGFLYIALFVYLNIFAIRTLSIIFTNNFMMNTPIYIFAGSLVLVSAYIIRGGVEVLARLGEIMLSVVLFLLVLVVLLILPEIEFHLFQPVLEKGIFRVIEGVYPASFFFAETVIMLMLIPFLSYPRGAGKAIAAGVFIAGFFQLIITGAVIGIFDSLASNINFTTLRLIRYISVGELIERVEPFIMFLWVGGGVIKIGVFHYCAVLGTAQWLNLKEYKSLVLPFGVLLVVLSLVVWDSVVHMLNNIALVTPYFLGVEVGIPAFLLVISILRGKGAKRQ